MNPQVATPKDPSNGKVSAIPVLCSRVGAEREIQLVHGNHARPAFETAAFDAADKLTCLVRKMDTAPPPKDLGMKFMVSGFCGVSFGHENHLGTKFNDLSLQVPDKSGASVLAPGVSMAPRQSQKRKNSESGKVDDLPMLER